MRDRPAPLHIDEARVLPAGREHAGGSALGVFAKYWLLQLPGTALVAAALYGLWRWWELPGWMAVGLLALWVAKDAVLYPFLRASYGPQERGGVKDLVGARAVATERLAPRGYVRVRHELWSAEATGGQEIEAGTTVRVEAVEGLTLRVNADEEPQQEREPAPDAHSGGRS